MLFDGPPAELLRDHGAQLAGLGLLPADLQAGAAAARRARAAQREAGPLLEVKGLTFTYPGAVRPALADVSLSLQPGEWALLVGSNGSGKTTLSQLLMGLQPLPRGRLFWRGRDLFRTPVEQLAREIGYVFQQPEHQMVASSVWEECLFGVRAQLNLRAGQEIPRAERERAEALLLQAGLWDKREDSPYLLSGGEKRLLSVIAQFILPKSLYILDEPTAGTDYRGIQILLELCRQQAAAGAALLVITHDPQWMEEDADLCCQLEQGNMLVRRLGD
ncbi:ABC transporter ATP-binding protein [Paenibacillus sp. JX-17]|uniref:ABC transporter ATP-binding protein n=1 Tax=Paenibacillus lacisoli TaxID=3064525 RepID=A0ABT9CHA5_9BACL|nr:ABC transporter ATP-binding protein [Paenibacillus sp. JX-17]MDO7908275.1 ABC transporter ATP-binding protein [Paenibacillus sp. JX-17]